MSKSRVLRGLYGLLALTFLVSLCAMGCKKTGGVGEVEGPPMAKDTMLKGGPPPSKANVQIKGQAIPKAHEAGSKGGG